MWHWCKLNASLWQNCWLCTAACAPEGSIAAAESWLAVAPLYLHHFMLLKGFIRGEKVISTYVSFHLETTNSILTARCFMVGPHFSLLKLIHFKWEVPDLSKLTFVVLRVHCLLSHSFRLKVPYYAKLTQPMFSKSNTCLCEVPRKVCPFLLIALLFRKCVLKHSVLAKPAVSFPRLVPTGVCYTVSDCLVAVMFFCLLPDRCKLQQCVGFSRTLTEAVFAGACKQLG